MAGGASSGPGGAGMKHYVNMRMGSGLDVVQIVAIEFYGQFTKRTKKVDITVNRRLASHSL